MYHLVADLTDFLVVDKCAGVDFHSQSGQSGLAAQLATDLAYPIWPVHRLDKLTSGLLIFAKSAEAAAEFGELFAQQQIEKTYLALARGKPKKKQGRILGDMAKSRRGQFKLLRSREHPAITDFISISLGEGLRLYRLHPKTGRTHQLRVALSSLSVPILGDSLYGGEAAERMYLHAWQLAFNWRGERLHFTRAPSEGDLFTQSQVMEILQAWANTGPQ